METILKKSTIGLFVAMTLGFQFEMWAQTNSKNQKQIEEIATSRSYIAISTAVKKELAWEKEIDRQHLEMHTSDEYMAWNPINNNIKLAGNMQIGEMHAVTSSEVHFADTEQKLQSTHDNIKAAEVALEQSAIFIVEAKEKLLQDEKKDAFAEYELIQRNLRIMNAEERVEIAKKNLKAQHEEIHQKMMEFKKANKESKVDEEVID